MRHFKHRVGPTLASYRVANKYVAGFATVGPTNPMLSGMVGPTVGRPYLSPNLITPFFARTQINQVLINIVNNLHTHTDG